MHYQIRKAGVAEVEGIVEFIDSTFTKEGYGFVTSAQVNTEVKRGSVWVAEEEGRIIGVRIGLGRVYNLAVHPAYRRKGIGRALIEVLLPETIRVKATPVGHLSKEQLAGFVPPRGFYKALGYKLDSYDYARNFWQKGKDRAHFHKQGKTKHIEIYKRKDETNNY